MGKILLSVSDFSTAEPLPKRINYNEEEAKKEAESWADSLHDASKEELRLRGHGETAPNHKGLQWQG